MRVLHVLEVSHGGVVSYVRSLASEQVLRGGDVHVLAPEAAGSLPGSVHRWAPRRRSPVSLHRARAELLGLVRTLQPDIVHLHSFFPGLLGRTARLAPCVVYQPHSWAFEAVRWPFARWVARWERAALRRTDRLVVNCSAEAEEAARNGVAVEADVVGVPLDLDYFSPLTVPRAGGNQVPQPNLLLCVGRISRQKGQEQLAAAWEAQPIPNALLVFVGPGDSNVLARAARNEFGRSIISAGSVEDVRPYLASASVSVLPSRYEGQSVAMAEAMACGVPVVMTDVNGAREAVAPSGAEAAGAVVPVGDMKSLLREAARRLQEPDLLSREGSAGRARARDLFNVERVTERVQAAYDAAAARKETEG